jgi:ATP-dependent DNA helicase DinG
MSIVTSGLIAYKRYLKNKGWEQREGQRLMVDTINKAMSADLKHAIVEAGTGVGKTVGYSIPAIAHCIGAGKKLVISTASVALQDQIIQNDIPDIIKNSGLDFSFAVAKGRRRYVCTARLFGEECSETDETETLIDDDEIIDDIQSEEDKVQTIDDVKVVELRKLFSREEWNGDRDVMPIEVNYVTWQSISTDHKGCNKNTCTFAMQCPYLKARKELENKQVIIANHSLVLADLSHGGGVVLPPTSECAFVFDEGHHLPGSAVGFMHKEIDLAKARSDYRRLCREMTKMALSFDYAPVQSIALRVSESIELMRERLKTLKDVSLVQYREYANKSGIFRFRLGKLGAFQEEAKELLTLWGSAVSDLETIKAIMESDACTDMKKARNTWLPVSNKVRWTLADHAMLFKCFAIERARNQHPLAKWLVFKGKRVAMMVSPTHAGRALQSILWSKAYAVVVTSATLRFEGDFERVMEHLGAPQGTPTCVVDSPYDYAKMVRFAIPDFGFDPTPENEKKTVIAITRYLVEHMNWGQGNLVLFTSYRQLKDVYNIIPEKLRKCILRQDEYSKTILLQTHKARIDEGKGSTLFGVASLSEGVNLPGKYVTHVVIAKLAFDVPTDPVGLTVDEHCRNTGRSAFLDIILPTVATRLNQACGRLIRTEKDSGTISILDRRIRTKKYGLALLNSIPMWTTRHADETGVWVEETHQIAIKNKKESTSSDQTGQ